MSLLSQDGPLERYRTPLAMYLESIRCLLGAFAVRYFADQAIEVAPSPSRANENHVALLIPSSMPAFAEVLDPRLVAFSIEADRWPDWAGYGVGHPNAFTQQLLANLQARTGLAPAIRIGGELCTFSLAHSAADQPHLSSSCSCSS